MSEAYIGELRLFPFDFAPQGWLRCDGQQLSISTNQPLFALLGTMYGGNGQTTFALPDLRGRTPLHIAQNHPQGQSGGTPTHTLTVSEMPQHLHQMQARAAQATLVGGAVPAATKSLAQAVTATNPVQEVQLYGAPTTAAMKATAIAPTGGSQPHENRQPFLTLNWCIATSGLFPSRN